MEYHLVMPASKLYIPSFENFIHAFHHWHNRLHESQRPVWFIVNDDHPLMVRGLGQGWMKLDHACKWPARLWDNHHVTRTSRGPWVRGRKAASVRK